jgi:hypothetical protein
MSIKDYQISTFRGLAGEVIYSFIAPSTIISAIPVMIFIALSSIGLFFLIPEKLFPLHILLMYLLTAISVARFAIPASRGYINSGWFNIYIQKGETLAYAQRYLVLTLFWGIPCGILLLVATSLGGDAFQSDISYTSMGGAGFIFLLVGIILIFAPTLSFIICAASSEVRQVIGLNPWKQLIQEDFPNLVIFYASIFGGVIVFWLIYALPLGLLTAVLSLISTELAGITAVFIISLPAAMTPILIGRLAGSIVYGLEKDNEEYASDTPDEPQQSDAQTNNIISPSSIAYKSTASSNSDTSIQETNIIGNTIKQHNCKTNQAVNYSPAENTNKESSVNELPKSSFILAIKSPDNPLTFEQKLLKKVDAYPPYQLENTIMLAKNRLNTRPDDALIHVEVVLLNLLCKKTDEALALASKAIELNLAKQHDLLTVNMLKMLDKDILRLDISFEDSNRCVELLIHHDLLYQASLCLLNHKKGNALNGVESKILSIAVNANKQKHKKQTFAILTLFKDNFPNSKYIAKINQLLEKQNQGS